MASAALLPPSPLGPSARPAPATELVVAGVVLSVLLMAGAVVVGAPGAIGGAVLVDLGLVAFVTHSFFLKWSTLAVTVVLCILLVPVGRYGFPVTLPFQLEPYRALVAVIALIWGASLLVQPDTRWIKTGMFLPLFVVAVSLIVSVATNPGRLSLAGVQPNVVKQLSMFASFFFVLLFMSAVITTRAQLIFMTKALVAGGGWLSGFALVQYRTGFNIFDHLNTFIPIFKLVPGGIPDHIESRGGGDVRIYASAAHPIALSAALVMLFPLGLYLIKECGGPWWKWKLLTALIAVAALATVSRTGSVMLLVELLTFLALKPRQVLRLWPWLIPFLVVVHIAAPAALGGLKSAFLPTGGLVAEQKTGAGKTSSNRLADLGPSLQEWSKKPAFGEGFGTRITAPKDPHVNALILDDQWLGTLLETGALGFLSLIWLFVATVRRTGRAARRNHTNDGWLLAALAAAIAAFAVGMITFDAFAFVQSTFIVFALIGVSIAARRVLAQPHPGVVAPVR